MTTCPHCKKQIETEPKNTIVITLENGEKWEVEKEIHHKDKTYAECKKDCPKGWEIPTYFLIQELRNSDYCKELGLLETWEFVQNPDKIEKSKGNVAGFFAGSGGTGLGCCRYPAGSNSSLGVRFVRKIKGAKK